MDVRALVMARVGSYFAILALLAGLGLLLASGVRDSRSWAFFTLMTVVGALGLAFWLQRVLGSTRESRAVEGNAGLAAEAPEPIRSDGESSSADGPGEVDYLTALRHEFRTPLNAMLGFSDVLLSGIDGDVNDSQREDLEIIRASGIRLRVLLDSALDLSRLVAGELRLNAERVDIRDLVDRVSAEAEQLWSSKRTACCTVPAQPCITEADAIRLRRSVLVLADFLASHDRDAAIVLGVAASGSHVVIELVADGSTSAALDAIPTIAEVLATEDVATIRRWPVAVTSEVITRHHGSLYHGSAPSRFLIRLPLEPV